MLEILSVTFAALQQQLMIMLRRSQLQYTKCTVDGASGTSFAAILAVEENAFVLKGRTGSASERDAALGLIERSGNVASVATGSRRNFTVKVFAVSFRRSHTAAWRQKLHREPLDMTE